MIYSLACLRPCTGDPSFMLYWSARRVSYYVDRTKGSSRNARAVQWQHARLTHDYTGPTTTIFPDYTSSCVFVRTTETTDMCIHWRDCATVPTHHWWSGDVPYDSVYDVIYDRIVYSMHGRMAIARAVHCQINSTARVYRMSKAYDPEGWQSTILLCAVQTDRLSGALSVGHSAMSVVVSVELSIGHLDGRDYFLNEEHIACDSNTGFMAQPDNYLNSRRFT